MFQNTSDPEAASRLFNLPQFHVSDVVVDDEGGRTVTIGTGVIEAGCPTCGVSDVRGGVGPGASGHGVSGEGCAYRWICEGRVAQATVPVC